MKLVLDQNMRAIVEVECGSCTDGRVQTPNTYESSIECEACKGTALQFKAMPLAEVVAYVMKDTATSPNFVPGTPDQAYAHPTSVLGRISALENEIRVLKARMQRVDGHSHDVQISLLANQASYAPYAATPRKGPHTLEAERMERLQAWCDGRVYT
jgi:hypothetical protein